MSEKPQFDSLKDEVYYLIGRATAPLTVAEIYERSDLALDVSKVSKAVYSLASDKRIVRVDSEGRARYTLAPGAKATAPAGKAGRQPAAGAPQMAVPHIPTLGEQLAAMRETAPSPKPPQAQADASLADAIIARLKRDLGPLLRPPVVGDLDVTTAPGAIHISVQSVEINISIGVGA